MLQSGKLGRFGHEARFRHLLFYREVVPEKRNAKCSVSSLEGFLQAGGVVNVGGHDFRARLRQGPCLLGICVSGNRAGGETAVGVGKNRPYQPAALRPRSTHDRDNLLVSHEDPP